MAVEKAAATAAAAAAADVLRPFTELPSPLTSNLDSVGAAGIVRCMRANDAALFRGHAEHASLTDCAPAAARVAQLAAEAVRSGRESAVVLAGAGTSGRLAMTLARAYNRALERARLAPCFHYLIAGGEQALFSARELAEDDATLARADLQALEKAVFARTRGGRVLYVGITCGLSATYVGAQLEYALRAPNYAAVLVGFNPVERARRARLATWGRSFHDLALEMQARASETAGSRVAPAHVLTPVVGPEAVQGSTRLKGGTATKILLDAIFGTAVSAAAFSPLCGSPPVGSAPGEREGGDGAGAHATPALATCERGVRACLAAFDGAAAAAYSHVDRLGELVSLAGAARAGGGSVVYLGGGGAGLVGMVDASEQVPTFGADERDFRASFDGGWDAIRRHPATHRRPARAGGRASADDGRSSEDGSERVAGDIDGCMPQRRASLGGGDGASASAAAEAAGDAGKVGGRAATDDDAEPGAQPRLEVARTASLSPLPVVAAEAFVVAASGLAKLGKDDLLVVLGGGNGRLPASDDVAPGVLKAVLAAKAKQKFKMAVVTPEVAQHDRMLCVASDSASDPQHDDDEVVTPPLVAEALAGVCAAAELVLPLTLPSTAAAPLLPGVDSLAEVALKMALNVVSTGAHVLIGKVYGNRMIDVRVSNDKLLHRAAAIVSELAACDTDLAMDAVLRAIHGLEGHADAELLARPAEEHISVAVKKERVVPTAALLAIGVVGTPKEAERMLKDHPSVREAVATAHTGGAK